MNKGVFPKEKSDEEYVFYVEKKHFHCLAIEQDILRVYVLIRIRILDINFLCLLHKYRVLKSVWTTNFDGLVERAAHQANITPINVNLDNPERIHRTENSQELLYVALHGDYKYSELKNTATELDSQQDTFKHRLKRILCRQKSNSNRIQWKR